MTENLKGTKKAKSLLGNSSLNGSIEQNSKTSTTEINTVRQFTRESINCLKTYVFGLSDKKSGPPFFIGIGTKNDIFNVIQRPHTKELALKTKDLKENGHTIEPIIIAYGLNKATAQIICNVVSRISESGWISSIKLD